MANKKSEPYSGLEFLPPASDKEAVGKRIFQALNEIINDKIDLGLHSKWMRNHELIHNKHWRDTSSAPVPLVSANLIFVHIQRTANTLTDNNPTFNVSRLSDDEAETYPPEIFDDIQHAADHWWTDQEQQDVLDSSVRNGEEYGIATEKVIFNPDVESEIGEVETVIVDPFHFGFYPVKLKDPRDLQKSEAVLHFYPMSIREAKRRWADVADQIKPDSEILKDLGDERREISGESAKSEKSMMISIASTVKEVFNWLTGTPLTSEEVLIVECWCHDYSKKSSRSDNGDGTITENTEYAYPGNIRYAVSCNAGKLVLDDRKNPSINWELPLEEIKKCYLFDKFPFTSANSVKDTSCAWGSSDIEQLEWLNIELDKAISQMVLYKDAAARLKIVNPIDSGVEDYQFDNYLGTIRPTSATSPYIRYLEVPSMPVEYTAAISLFKDMFFLVAGTFEMDQAQTQGRSVIAYKAIAALLERAATMMRGKTRSYSRLIRERGRMFFSHVQNWYTEDRWITFQDDTGIEKSKKINGEKLRIPAKLTVVTGSTLPVSRVQQREEALTLFQQQAIDRADLLDKIEWPNRTQVLERMKQGPIGEAMKNLETIGVPSDLLKIFMQAAMADPKKLQDALEKGKFPTFSHIFKAMLTDMQAAQGQQPEQPQGDPVQQAEASLKVAEAEKTKAETQLIVEKIMTEKVNQLVKEAGMKFDEQKLAMDRAKIVKDIESTDTSDDIEKAKTIMGLHKTAFDADMLVSNQNNRPGYNEQGLKSNNQGE
jgi:hypothetical protein